MLTRLAVVTIPVRDQDEALQFYTEKLGLEKMDDMVFGEGNRWLTVTTSEQKELQIFLMQADGFGMNLTDQVGRMPTWAFYTNDCHRTYETFSARGIKFVSPPQQQPWGIEAVFEDLYGNKFSVVQEVAAETAPTEKSA
ncbi:MAG TPA: VOC family protein [Pyrinomonadaceae bacterium]|jgi:predicted enzyme related to lactoylglutathione lyase